MNLRLFCAIACLATLSCTASSGFGQTTPGRSGFAVSRSDQVLTLGPAEEPVLDSQAGMSDVPADSHEDATEAPTRLSTLANRIKLLGRLREHRTTNDDSMRLASALETQSRDNAIGVGGDPLDGSYPEDHHLVEERLGLAYPGETTSFLDECQYAPRSDSHDCGDGYLWRLLPQGVIYKGYLAGAKESRFRSVWNHENNDGDIWDISLGGRVTLARFGTAGHARPEGIEIGLEGAGLVRLDPEENHDVHATDYRFGIPVTWGDAYRQSKIAYYHLSSHVGDEFLIRNPGFNRLNYSRDVLVFGQSIYPADNWRIYGEIGYAVYNDISQPWELQFGIEHAPMGNTGFRGAPFVAFNGHLREEVNYGGNFVAQGGWAWRRSAASGLFRLGVEYYNGKSDQFSFFDDSEQKTGFGIWYDY